VRKAFFGLLKTTLLATVAALPLHAALADDTAPPPLPRNMFSGVGLIEMPTARMAPDGEMSAGASYFQNNQRYGLGYQILPWLEGSFRYSGLQYYSPKYPVYYDRSFEVKARLWNEGEVLPAVAVGIDDIVGTGVYGGEYVVASKQFGSVDTAVGMGWGRLATANTVGNPLGAISSAFYDRHTTTTGLGGDFNLKEYFRGRKIGIFGGIDWRTPVDGLTLLAEISSDSYQRESSTGNFTPRSQFNFGASYQASGGVALGLGYLYGRVVAGNISFQIDPTTEPYDQKIGAPTVPEPVVRTADQQQHALQSMLYGPQPMKVSAALASKNEMVDMLWRRRDVQNVDIRGHTLLLSVPAGTPPMRCLEIAGVLQSYESDLTAVVLQPPDGSPSTRCATPAAPDRAFRQGVFIGSDQDVPRAVPATLTIDARPQRADARATARAITAAARKQLIQIHTVQITASDAVVYYTNYHYRHESAALERLTALLMREAPPDVERFRLIAVVDGIPLREFDVIRAPQERKYALDQTLNVVGDADGATMGPAPMTNPAYVSAMRGKFPQFDWSIFPQFRQQFFDPNNPIGVQFLADLQGTVALAPGLSITGSLETSLYDTFRTDRAPDSVLPHVRTNFTRYFADGKTGIGDLQGNYIFRLGPNVTALARAGYLESMFGGAGGEVLWRPENQRWALGIDAFEVWQRNFDRLFGFQRYHVFTGHVSAYYESPWYGLNFAVHAGQYLAGDRGLTIEVTRRFWTGVEIGAFFTKTNVSAQQFGEGSFDKGIIIRIPLGWALPVETGSVFGMDLRPIQRDGGQRLYGDTVLYNVTRDTSRGEIYRIEDGEPSE